MSRIRTPRAVLIALVIVGSVAKSEQLSAQEPVQPVAAADTTSESLISPRAAMLRSFAIPGWGQSYAGAPGRGAVYFALEAGSLWMVYKSYRQLSTSRAHDRWLRETGALAEGRISGLTRSRSAQFEDWLTLAGAVLLFSGADAYVTAQLADFGEQVDVRPGPGGGTELRMGIPVGR